MSAEKDLQREIKFLTETAAAEQEEKLSISSEMHKSDGNTEKNPKKKESNVKTKVIEPERHTVIKKIANPDRTPNKVSYAKKHNFEVDNSMKEEKETEERYLDSVMGNKYVKEIVDKTKEKADNGIFKKHDEKLNPVIGFIVKLFLLPYIFFRDYTKAFVAMSSKAKRKRTASNFSTLLFVAAAQVVVILALEYFEAEPAYWTFMPVVVLLVAIYFISKK